MYYQRHPRLQQRRCSIGLFKPQLRHNFWPLRFELTCALCIPLACLSPAKSGSHAGACTKASALASGFNHLRPLTTSSTPPQPQSAPTCPTKPASTASSKNTNSCPASLPLSYSLSSTCSLPSPSALPPLPPTKSQQSPPPPATSSATGRYTSPPLVGPSSSTVLCIHPRKGRREILRVASVTSLQEPDSVVQPLLMLALEETRDAWRCVRECRDDAALQGLREDFLRRSRVRLPSYETLLAAHETKGREGGGGGCQDEASARCVRFDCPYPSFPCDPAHTPPAPSSPTSKHHTPPSLASSTIMAFTPPTSRCSLTMQEA